MSGKALPFAALTGLLAVMVLVGAGSVWALVLWLLLVAPPCRYLLSLAGLSLIRAYVIRNVRPNGGQLPEPGAVADPDAAWRQWLDPGLPVGSSSQYGWCVV